MLTALVAALAVLVALVPLALGAVKNPALPALAAAALSLLGGAVSPGEALWALGSVAAAGAIIVSLGVMAAVLDAAGFFRWAAFNLAARCGQRKAALFWQVALLAFLATLFLGNEGSLLLITPLVVEVCRWLRLPQQATTFYLVAVTLTALATGVAAGTSSLGGLLAMALAGIGPVQYLRLLFVPGLAGAFVCAAVLYAASLCLPPPPPLRRAAMRPLVKDWGLSRAALVVVGLVWAVGPALHPLGVPPYALPVAGAALLLLLAALRCAVGTRVLWRRAPWSVFGFALGMLMVAQALYNSGLGDAAQRALQEGWSLEELGVALAASASLITAVPALAIGQLVLGGSAGAAGFAATVLGAGYGGILNPAGSLAALTWLQRSGGPPLSAYLGAAFLVVPPAFLVALLCARWWIAWLG